MQASALSCTTSKYTILIAEKFPELRMMLLVSLLLQLTHNDQYVSTKYDLITKGKGNHLSVMKCVMK